MNFESLFKTKSIDKIINEAKSSDEGGPQLKKVLGVWDLTAFGVAAIIGAGIFSTIGNAAFHGGPAVVFLFVLTAIACAFSAFCYAEFASSLPIAGSAYTYAYASFGEIVAWIIGWDLLMEYAISNIAVAISWSEYFTHILSAYGINIPKYFTMDFLSAYRGFNEVQSLLVNSPALDMGSLTRNLSNSYSAWVDAPRLLGIPVICNLPALFITALVTMVAYYGIKESRLTSNILVGLKVSVIILVICLGAFYINPGNWTPFAPNGVSGIFKGVSAVFFAYIGFDAISTTAEECKNPQRDLPRGMIYSLIICTVLYVLMSLVLTGIVKYNQLDVGDPLAFVFGPSGANLPWISGIIAITAVVALFTVLLVYQLGQPRIWMAMSRDGLLPPIFSAIHPVNQVPWFSTLFTGVVVAVPSLFMNLTEVTDLTSTGTLFAFALVCAGVLTKDADAKSSQKKFRIPYINSRYIFPVICLVGILLKVFFDSAAVSEFFRVFQSVGQDFTNVKYLISYFPAVTYLIGMLILSYVCFKKSLSLIPTLGLASCTYLMTELGVTNWLRFGVWLLVGFGVYFFYGANHSRLRVESNSNKVAKNS